MNTKIVLKKHPLGNVSVDDFNLVTSPIDSLEDHQVLVQGNWLSLDPYVKGRISQNMPIMWQLARLLRANQLAL